MGTIAPRFQPLTPPTALLLQMCSPQSGRFYRCDVVFGSPNADCRGTGICKIMAVQGAALPKHPRLCRQTPVLFTRADHGGLAMLLVRELLCTRVWKDHLRHGLLLLPEPFELPLFLIDHFQLSTPFLPPGAYPIQEMPDHYRIAF